VACSFLYSEELSGSQQPNNNLSSTPTTLHLCPVNANNKGKKNKKLILFAAE